MAQKRAHEVRIGTSGWHYPLTGYGPWTGVFYPLKHGLKIPLRHRPWSDDLGPTLKLLNEHDAAFVQIDEPKFTISICQNQLPNITSVRKR